MKLRSPAKVNLFLRILGKRPDGFHELASLFQAVSLSDYLTFEPSHTDRFTCSDLALPLDEKNLVTKAKNLFQKKLNRQIPLFIHLEKSIPMEAGLGGGSSNAATTLYALNELSGSHFSQSELIDMSAQLGSDVSFFFSTGSAYCTGRGETIQDISLPPATFTLCKPPFGSSTPEVFRALKLNSTSSLSPEDLLASFVNGQPIYINDLEAPAFLVSPALKAYKDSLHFENVMITGSGSTFVCSGKNLIKPTSGFVETVTAINRRKPNWY